MDQLELRDQIQRLHGLVSEGERAVDPRSDADAAFRADYQHLRNRWEEIPSEVSRPVKRAFLALVGDDDWKRAREHLAQALDRISG